MSYEERKKLLQDHDWGNRGDWDNWFCPFGHTRGWNFDTVYGAAHQIMENWRQARKSEAPRSQNGTGERRAS